MKKLRATQCAIYTALFFIMMACEAGEVTTYKYTVKNESGVNIKIISYTGRYEPYIINLENGEEFTDTYKDGLPPRGYDFRFFFGDSKRRADSLRIIYDNAKYQDYNDENSTDERHPLYNLTGNTEETYTFTIEDYQNAEDCNGNCE